jgi:hypothetical protein
VPDLRIRRSHNLNNTIGNATALHYGHLGIDSYIDGHEKT